MTQFSSENMNILIASSGLLEDSVSVHLPCMPALGHWTQPPNERKNQEPDISGEQEETKYSGRGREQRDTDEK